MPFKWDAASERNLLLFAIGEMNPPATSIWTRVAEKLGNDLNANACRYHHFSSMMFHFHVFLAFKLWFIRVSGHLC